VDTPELKHQQGRSGIGWLRSPDGDITGSGRPLVRHCRRMLRFNAAQLWHNLIRQGWERVPP
jgi:hypothetical protein